MHDAWPCGAFAPGIMAGTVWQGWLHAATVSLAAAGGWKTHGAMGVSSSGTDGIYNDTLLFLVLL